MLFNYEKVRSVSNDPFWAYTIQFVHFNPPYRWYSHVEDMYGTGIAESLLELTSPPILDCFFALLDVE